MTNLTNLLKTLIQGLLRERFINVSQFVNDENYYQSPIIYQVEIHNFEYVRILKYHRDSIIKLLFPRLIILNYDVKSEKSCI